MNNVIFEILKSNLTKNSIEAIAEKHANVENIYILAKEPNLGAANEGALKLTETTQGQLYLMILSLNATMRTS